MSATQHPDMARERQLFVVAAAAHLALAIALVVIAISGASVLVPVSLTLRGNNPGQFTTVDLATAAVIVALVSVLCRALAATSRTVSRGRALWYLEFSQVSGIVVFLIAQLNGITEAGTLILCYAVAAGTVAVLWLQSRVDSDSRSSPWPYSATAALAVVPWGIIALYQVTGLAVAAPLPPLVRVMTVVMLAVFAALWCIERRWQLGRDSEARASLLRAIVMVAIGLSLLLLAVGLARPSALL